MQTIKLRVRDDIYKKLLWLLGKFDQEEVEIISEDSNYLENKKFLAKELEEIEQKKAKMYSLQDAEKLLEEVIKKHEEN